MSNFTDAVIVSLVGKLSTDELRLVRDSIDLVSRDYTIKRNTTEIVPREYVLPDCYKMFMASKSIDGRMKNSSAETYRYYIEGMLQTIQKPVAEITTNDLRAYIITQSRGKKGKPLSKSTINVMKTCLSSFFAWCLEEEYIQKNPMVKIHREHIQKVKEKELTDVDIAKIRCSSNTSRAYRLQGSTERDKAIVELLLSSGIRVTELCRLKVSDVDIVHHTATVFGKGDKYRIVYFTGQAAYYLKSYLDSRNGNSEYLFCSLKEPYGQLQPNAVRVTLRKMGRDAGVEHVHPHRFRRTFATNGVRRGMSVDKMQVALGHSRIETTIGYVNTSQEQVRSEYDRCFG